MIIYIYKPRENTFVNNSYVGLLIFLLYICNPALNYRFVMV